MGSPMTLSHLTLSDLERSYSRSFRFRGLISCKRAELGHMLLLNINRKAYMGSQMTSHLTLSDLERSNSRPHIFAMLSALFPTSEFNLGQTLGIHVMYWALLDQGWCPFTGICLLVWDTPLMILFPTTQFLSFWFLFCTFLLSSSIHLINIIP